MLPDQTLTMAISEWIPSTYKNKNKNPNRYFHRTHVQFCGRIPEDIVIIDRSDSHV